jgi:hypothetical protein
MKSSSCTFRSFVTCFNNKFVFWDRLIHKNVLNRKYSKFQIVLGKFRDFEFEMSDESDSSNKRSFLDDSDSESDGGKRKIDISSNPFEDSAKSAAVEELLGKKKARVTKPFTEDILVSKEGLPLIYEQFYKECRMKGRGHEADDLKRLITLYSGWAWQLYPGLAFPDMINRIDTLGSKAVTRGCLLDLRDKERNRYLVCNF